MNKQLRESAEWFLVQSFGKNGTTTGVALPCLHFLILVQQSSCTPATLKLLEGEYTDKVHNEKLIQIQSVPKKPNEDSIGQVYCEFIKNCGSWCPIKLPEEHRRRHKELTVLSAHREDASYCVVTHNGLNAPRIRVLSNLPLAAIDHSSQDTDAF